MARAVLRHLLLGLAATGLLSGCVDSGGAGTGGASAGLLASPAKKSGKQEVEAPEVFQTTDSALWDGRPSLGGIWVASPEVTDPERVVIFNPASGKTVNGALFRRERENPGPTLQLSSDAAEALGILAGQPTEIRVTALRKLEEPEPVAAPAKDEAAKDEAAKDETAKDGTAAIAAAPAAAAGATKDTAAIASAALDAADAGAVAADGVVATDPAAAAEAVTEAPKRKTWKERRAEAKAKREAEKAAKAEAAAAPVAGAAAIAVDGVDPAASAVATVETAPLDARSPDVAAGVAPQPEKKKTKKQLKAEEDAAAAAAAAAATAAPEATPTAAGRPIQIASFSKEENAVRAVEALAKIGVTAQPQKSERAGKIVWGVVASGDAELLKKIKAAGFADAYFLK